jgi:hypothetical protein
MLSPRRCFAAFFVSVTVIAASTEVDAQQQRGFALDAAAARPPAPPAMVRPGPPPTMARPAPPAFRPPTMARPVPPAFRPAPQPQHPAISPRPTPQIAAPPVAPAIAGPLRPSAPSPIARLPQQELIGLRAQRIQQAIQERQRDILSRRTALRQEHIDRWQLRIQQLQSQQPQGAQEQRAQQRLLEAQQRLLRGDEHLQQRDLARQQQLGIQPPAARPDAAAVQAAARGRFAAQFASADRQAHAAGEARLHGWAPHDAWRHGPRVVFVFVPWVSNVFWPFAYSDIFHYTFWPSAYEPGYWAYAYDDFVDNVFWGAYGPYAAYAGIGPSGYSEPGGAIVGEQALKQLCEDPGKGITAWPIALIEQAVQPTPEQREFLDELKSAAAKAADAFKQSCGDSYAMTPPGRLRAMTNRISATLEAVRIVRPALEKFYNSLSDEQQARFTALGPNIGEPAQRQPQTNDQSETCGDPKNSLTQVPIERIETVIRPTGAQKEALERLSDATNKAVGVLQAACPEDVPLTPIGRLEAMEKRLDAMLQAAKLVQPALDEFYATLSSEQKARFNALRQFADR